MSNPNPDSLDFSRFQDDPEPAAKTDTLSLDFSRFQDDDASDPVIVAQDGDWRSQMGINFNALKKAQAADRQRFYQRSGLGRGAISGILEMAAETATDMTEAMGHPLKSAMAILKGIGDVPGGIVGAMAEGPAAFGKTVVEGIVAPLLLYPVELIVGKDIFGEGQGNELTAEERYVKGRSAAANIFGVLLGMKAGQMVKTGFIGQEAVLGGKQLKGLNKAANALGPDDLAALISKDVPVHKIKKLMETAGKPEFLMQAKAGFADALVGGGTIGLLEGHGYEDRIAAATTLGIVALPFGLAAEAIIPAVSHLRGKKTAWGRADAISVAAGEAMRLREINYIDGKSILENSFNIATLLETEDLAMTMARNAIEYDEIHIGSKTFPDEQKEVVKSGRNMSVVPQVIDPARALSQLNRQQVMREVDILEGSTARDDSGKPLELFHGRSNATEFRRRGVDSGSKFAGIHFTDDPGRASEYAGTGIGAHVRPVHLNVRNTFKTDELVDVPEIKRIYREAGMDEVEINKYVTRDELGSEVFDALMVELKSNHKVSELLEKLGYDSVFDADVNDWIVFDPDKIVSSLGPKTKKVAEPGKPYLSAIHAREDGTFDVLIAPTTTMPRTLKMFEKIGWVEGQQVGYAGSTDWFIESNVRKTSERKKFDTVNLIPRNGGAIVKDVPLSELTRPTSATMNDLYVMQGRMIGADDIWNHNTGFTRDAGNTIGSTGLGADDPATIKLYAMNMTHVMGMTLVQNGAEISVYNGRPNTPGVIDSNVDLTSKQVLKPGLNKLEMVQPDGLKKGIHIYVGGGYEMMKFPQQDGTTIKMPVRIGPPGQIMAFTNWKEHIDHAGKAKRGTDNAVILDANQFEIAKEAYAQYDPNDPDGPLGDKFLDTAKAQAKATRSPISAAMRDARLQDGIFITLSSESLGAAVSHARRANKYFPDEVVNRFGYMTPEVVRRGLTTAFFDHIGIVGDNVFPGEVTHLTHGAITTRDPSHARRGWASLTQQKHGGDITSPSGTIDVKAKRGLTTAHMMDQVDPALSRHLSRDTQAQKRYVDEQGNTHTQAQAAKLLDIQNQRGDIHVYQSADYIPPNDIMPFADAATSFMDKWQIKQEMRPAVMMLLEQEMGRELIGRTNRIPNADKRLIPQLKRDVAELDKVLNVPDYADPATHNQNYLDAVALRETFKKRIFLAENPQPKSLAPEDLAVFERLSVEAQKARAEAAKNVLNIAHEFGYIPEREGGVIKLREAESGAFMPVTFINDADAQDWIKKTGHPKGIELDGGGANGVPPVGVMGGAMPPSAPGPRPFEVPYQFSPNTRVTKILTLLDASAPWFTPKRGFFTAMDNMFGTTFLRDAYFPMQIARMKLEAARRPYLQAGAELEKTLSKAKIPRERWQVISEYREAMSSQNVIDELYTSRKLTDVEQKFANEFAAQKIDTVKVYEFEREYNKAKEKFDATLKKHVDEGASQDVLIALTDKWKQVEKDLIETHVMDDKHLNAVGVFATIRKMNPAVARLDGVTRLTRAMIDQSPDKATFAAANKMTPVELAAAEKLNKMYAAAGAALNVDQSVTNYMNHYRVTGDFEPANVKVDDPAFNLDQRNSKFASDLMRSGEMSVYEMDPIRAYVAYVNAGFADRLFNKHWDKAIKAVEANVNKMAGGREAAAKVAGEYMYGIKGVPAAQDILMQESMNKFLEALDVKLKVDVRKDLINTFMAASSGALLGMRPMQGIRDITSFAKMHITRFGIARFTKGVELAFTRDANGVLPIRKLAEDGTTPGLSMIDFMSDDELVSSMTGRAGNKLKELIFKSSKLGMDTSGQTSAYALAHAISYLEVRNRSSEWLNKLHSGSVSKQQAYKELAINTYDVPVIKIFDDLVKDGKFAEATEFLAQTTGGETAFIYGLANHAAGWGTNWGRLAGQFGTYSLWTRNFLGRVAGRGTAGERAAGMARLAAVETATFLAGRTLGFDMRSWSLPLGMAFAGGPMHDRYQQMMALAGARGSTQQQRAVSSWSIKNGNVPVLSTHMPGGLALSDYYKAYTARQNRFGWVPTIGAGMGFKIDETQRSFLDVLADEHPKLKGHQPGLMEMVAKKFE